MNERVQQIVQQIQSLEDELKDEIKKEEIKFEQKLEREQQEAIEGVLTYLKNAPILHMITSPIIYGLIIPAIILDICVWVYQAVNFRVYKIKPVKRGEYIVFDRQYLNYLNFIEKLNCLYCSYFNGLIAYVSEVAAISEQFWCPIKHAKKIAYRHSHYHNFFPYGDHIMYKKELSSVRKKLA